MSELNSMAPATINFTLEEFHNPQLVVINAVVHCLMSNSVVAARNSLTYNNGGITVTVPDGNKYLNLINMFQNMAVSLKEEFRKYKISINALNGFGGNSSPYAALHSREW